LVTAFNPVGVGNTGISVDSVNLLFAAGSLSGIVKKDTGQKVTGSIFQPGAITGGVLLTTLGILVAGNIATGGCITLERYKA
jgi:hypothetical protein